MLRLGLEKVVSRPAKPSDAGDRRDGDRSRDWPSLQLGMATGYQHRAAHPVVWPCLVMCVLGLCAAKLFGGDGNAKAQPDNVVPPGRK